VTLRSIAALPLGALALALVLPLAACQSGGAAGGPSGGAPGALSSAAASVTSPTAPVIQPGRPGEPNTSLTGTAVAPRPSGPLDPDDARFMGDMIVHHAQAIAMVSLARAHLTDPQVKALASRVADEQEPEIAVMARWLRERGQDVPPQAENPLFGANSHSGHGAMRGMASPEQLRQLGAARGVAADRLWLRLMTAHHEGALAMVLDQQRTGSDEVVTQLGDEIHVTQKAQINHMQRMLQRLT
jgi:uncharacterized protein (DUF305 family)